MTKKQRPIATTGGREATTRHIPGDSALAGGMPSTAAPAGCLQGVFTQRGEGWVETTLGDQIILQRGFDITKDLQTPGDVPVVSSGGIKSFHNTAMAKGPGVVIGRKGTLGKVFYLPNDFWPHDTTLWVKEFKGNHPRFVYYFFRNLDVAHLDTGTANPALNRNLLHPIRIRWPQSLAEQRRIVGILDEAFEGLATAKATAEQNLQNARALFESHLQAVFTQRGEKWKSQPFEDCIEDVKYTAKIQRKEFLEEGEYPIVSQEADFTNGYWDNAADVFKVTRPVVIFGDHTKVLKYVDFDFVLGADGVKILPPKQFLIPKFFFYHLRSAPLTSLGYARHYRLLKELEIAYPDPVKQTQIAKKLDALTEETQRLESLYQRKLAALDELKKSLLHRAFSGQL